MAQSLPHEIQTQRIILRPMVEEDAQLVVSWRNDPRVRGTSLKDPVSVLTIERHLHWFRRTRSERWDYILTYKETGSAIGSVSFSMAHALKGKHCAELGKYIGEASFEGKGLAAEASRAWLDFGFEELQFPCIFARTAQGNRRNIALNRKLGFVEKVFPVEFENPAERFVYMEILADRWVRPML